MLIAILLTFSRGVIIGCLAGILSLAFLRRKLTGRMIIVGTICIFAVVLACSSLPYPYSKFGIQGFVMYSDGINSPYRTTGNRLKTLAYA